MSDIVLYEGGKKRNIRAIGDIETDLSDGSTCLWMRKDAATFEPIKITTNGIFLAPFAYNEVDVDVQWIIDEYGINIDDWGFPHITLDDLDLSLDLDGFPDLEGFDLKDLLKDSDFDFDQDFDISLDDFDLHLDNLDTDLTLNLNTLELTETELPDEIRIMHVPNKTSYKDGEEIDLDGLEVQAFRKGEVWEDKDGKYWHGYIPVHELRYDPTIAKNSNPNNWLIDYGENPDNIPPVIYSANPISHIEYVERDEVKNKIAWEPEAIEYWQEIDILGYGTRAATKWTVGKHMGGDRYYLLTDASETRYRRRNKRRDKYSGLWGRWGNWSDWDVKDLSGRNIVFNGKREVCTKPLPLGIDSKGSYDLGGWKYTTEFLTPVTIGFESYDDDYGKIEWALIRGEDDGKNIHANIEHISVLWPRPKDNKLLAASFDISVEPKDGE